MSWINEHKRVWRVVILALLLIAFVGPWTFDLINVPSEYSCSAPFIRLKGDYCGAPLSGLLVLPALIGEFINVVMELVTGAIVITDLGRRLLVILSALLLFLPFFSTLLLILPGNRRRQQIFHLAVWGLATASSLWWLLLLSTSERPQSQLWGVQLYSGLAFSVLILEVAALAIRRRARQAR
jgi:hypothetical protein